MPEERHTTDVKRAKLAELGKKRKEDRWDGYKTIGDIENGIYDRDHDHVSPLTKGADNVDSKIMLVLQDWASENDFIKHPYNADDPDNALGYTNKSPTIRNLKKRLLEHFRLELKSTYATNIFPFIKPGHTSSHIRDSSLRRAAVEYAIPQVEIVKPYLVVVLSQVSYWPIVEAIGLKQRAHLKVQDCINDPIDHENGYRIWCQRHTAWDTKKQAN